MKDELELKEEEAYHKIITKTCYVSNTLFFAFHIAYLIFFLVAEVYTMAYVNLFSIAMYLIMYLIISKRFYDAYAISTGCEISIYMITATVICGFDAGFHICLLGLIILIFYAGYFSSQRKKIIKPLLWSSLTIAGYFVLFMYCQFNEPFYTLNETIESVLLIGHILVVGLFTMAFLYVLVKYVVRLEKMIKEEATTDRLTQLPNRNALYDYLDRIVDKSEYLLAIFDIDDFKLVNDKFGHICGDHVLQNIANISKNNSSLDFVSRFGGEEFVIISKIENDNKYTFDKIDNIRKSVEKSRYQYDDELVKVTITMGVASYENNLSIDEWISIADKKLYKGKESGKNRTIM